MIILSIVILILVLSVILGGVQIERFGGHLAENSHITNPYVTQGTPLTAMSSLMNNGSPHVVCGVNSAGQIWCSDNGDTSNPAWTQVNGWLSNISVNTDGSVFGVNGNGNIFYAANYKIPNWVGLPGILTQISSSPNVVCGVNSANQIWCADTNIQSSPNWFQLPGGLTNISVNNDGSLMGVSSNGQIWFASNYKNANWVNLPGSLKQVSVNGPVACGVNAGNQIFCADQNISANPNWTNIPGSLTDLSVNSDGSLYGVNSGGQIFYNPSYKSGNWVLLPGTLVQLNSK